MPVISSARISVVPPLCFNDSFVIQLDQQLGGGGNQSNYYVNWYKKTNSNLCFNTTRLRACFGYPPGYSRKVVVTYPPNAAFTNINYVFGTKAATNKYPTVQTMDPTGSNWLITQLSQFGRIISSSPGQITVFLKPNDPQISAGSFDVVILNSFDFSTSTYSGVITDCNIFKTETICGYEPVAGGFNMLTFAAQEPGTYLVEVTDESYTTSTGSVIIEPVQPLECGIEIKEISCFGADDGELCANSNSLNDSNSTNNINYEWSVSNQPDPTPRCYDTEGNSTTCPQDIIDNKEGCWTYQIIETQCNAEDEPDSEAICYDLENNIITCPLDTPDEERCYYIIWIPTECPDSYTVISNSKCIKNLEPNTYCLTISNENNCKQTCCVDLVEPPELVVQILEKGDIFCSPCNGEEKGYILIEVSGGKTDCVVCNECEEFSPSNCDKGPYKYKINDGDWIDIDIDNRAFIDNLPEGTHKLKVQDCNCCINITEFTIDKFEINIQF